MKVRTSRLGWLETILRFNPRTREGANRWQVVSCAWLLSFNPRTREGANIIKPSTQWVITVSIHAPVKVRTAMLASTENGLLSFNPRTREGANLASNR